MENGQSEGDVLGGLFGFRDGVEELNRLKVKFPGSELRLVLEAESPEHAIA